MIHFLQGNVTSDETKVIVKGWKIFRSIQKIKNVPPPSTALVTIIVTAVYWWNEALSLLPPPSTGVNLFKDLL
jgi:hypothetical protein